MDCFGVPITLSCGATVMVRAWGHDDYAACLLDLYHLLQALQEGPADLAELLQQRVLEDALPQQRDRQLVVTEDLLALLSTLFELNRVAATSGRAVKMAADNGETGHNPLKPRWTVDDLRLAVGPSELGRVPPAAMGALYETLSRQEAARRYFHFVDTENFGVESKWVGKKDPPKPDWKYDTTIREQVIQQLGEEAGLLAPDQIPTETPFARLARQRRERRRK